MIGVRERSNPKDAARQFAEWASLFSERLFMIIQVYADESKKNEKFIAIGGYMAEVAEWKRIVKRWNKVLSDYRVPHFHFRQFNSRDDCGLSSSPYYGWSWRKRDGFFYDLGMSIGPVAVPIGGDYWLEEHSRLGLTSNPHETLFTTFFGDVKLAASHHFPTFTGKDFSDKIQFICDENPNKKWTEEFRKIHGIQKTTEPRYGGLAFENDENPAHCGLQVADYLAALYRQNAEEKRRTGELRNPRIIDVIVFRNLGDPSQRGFNFSFMPQPAFELMIMAFRKDEQRQKKEWESLGVTGAKYYPLEHVKTIKAVTNQLEPNFRGEMIQWIQNQNR